MAIILQEAPQECTIVQICGELDISAASDLQEQLLDILNRRTVSRLILDLSKLEFMDSSGVAVLVNTERRAGLLGRTLVLVAPQRPVLRVLQICGIDHCLPIFDDINTAAAWPQADVSGPGQSGDAPEVGDSDCAIT